MKKGKKLWLTLAAALVVTAVEVLAPHFLPLAELAADIVDPPPPGEPLALERWDEAGVSKPSGL